MFWKRFQLAILLITAALSAAAQETPSRIYLSKGEWVEEIRGTLAARKAIQVKTQAGPISLQGGQQNTVTYTIHKHVRARSEGAARRELAGFGLSPPPPAISPSSAAKEKGPATGSWTSMSRFLFRLPS